jgi:hypothetical protein
MASTTYSPAYIGHRFEALRLRFEDQTALLRFLSQIDMKILAGFLTLQLGIVGWHSQVDLINTVARITLGLTDLSVCIVAIVFVYRNAQRRDEVVATLNSLNTALGYNEPGVYLNGSLNPPMTYRPWARFYIAALVAAFLPVAVAMAVPATVIDSSEAAALESTQRDRATLTSPLGATTAAIDAATDSASSTADVTGRQVTVGSAPEEPTETNWQKWSAIGSLGVLPVSGLLAVIALFGPQFNRWRDRPILDVQVTTRTPHCQKTFLVNIRNGDRANCYYLRLWVENKGRSSAKNVEVFAKELSRSDRRRVDRFLPINMLWTHIGQMHFPAIHPQAGKHCDIVHLVNPTERSKFPGEHDPARSDLPADKAILCFDTIVKANTTGHLQPPGCYLLELQVAAENAKSKTVVLRIEHDGTWSDDEEQMLGELITFEQV